MCLGQHFVFDRKGLRRQMKHVSNLKMAHLGLGCRLHELQPDLLVIVRIHSFIGQIGNLGVCRVSSDNLHTASRIKSEC